MRPSRWTLCWYFALLRPIWHAVGVICQLHATGKRTRCVFWHIISDMTDEDYMRMAIEEARRAEELDISPLSKPLSVYGNHRPGTRRPWPKPQVIARACNLREITQDPAGMPSSSHSNRRPSVWACGG